MRFLRVLHLPFLLQLTLLALATGETLMPPPHLILLLDTSAAMASQGRMHKIHVALKGWIKDDAPQDMKISLWTFADEAKNLVSVLLDNSTHSRQEIEKHIPQEVEGTSCMRCALSSVLKNNTENATILLITHGADKFLEEDLDDLVKLTNTSQSTIISTLIGNVSNIDLFEKISSDVKYIPEDKIVFALLDVLEHAAHGMKELPTCVKVFENEVSPTESHFHFEFNIDNSVMNFEDICIKVYNWPWDMELNLTQDNSTLYMEKVELKEGYKKICFMDKKVGFWKVHIVSSQFNKFMALQVTACNRMQQTMSSIDLNCWIERGTYYPLICGYIDDVKKSVTGVRTSVDITEHTGKNLQIELQPVYAKVQNSFLYSCISLRKYINQDEAVFCSIRCEAHGQFTEDTNRSTTLQTSGQFSRFSWGGTLKLNKSNTEYSIASSVTDLKVSCLNGSVIILQFTAPLHALHYILSISTSLYTIFSEQAILLGTSPSQSGTQEQISFMIPSNYSSQQMPLYIIVRARGKNDLVGEISNLVQITCHLNISSTRDEETHNIPITTPETQEIGSTGNILHINTTEMIFTSEANNQSKVFEDKKDIAKEENNSSTSFIVIVTILAGVTLAVLSIVLRVHYIRRRKRSGTYYVECKYQDTESTEQT